MALGENFYAAHEQINIVGQPIIHGSVYAENAEDLDTAVALRSEVLSTGEIIYFNSISGQTNIIYNGDLTLPFDFSSFWTRLNF